MPGSDSASGSRNATSGRALRWALLALGALVLAAGPAFLGNYWLRVLSSIYMYAVLAQGINIMAGYTGYPAFGNVVFFGIGGYATRILMVKLQAPFVAGLVTGILACPLLGLLLVPPPFR